MLLLLSRMISLNSRKTATSSAVLRSPVSGRRAWSVNRGVLGSTVRCERRLCACNARTNVAERCDVAGVEGVHGVGQLHVLCPAIIHCPGMRVAQLQLLVDLPLVQHSDV